MSKDAVAFGQFEGRAAQLFALESEVLRAQITDFGGALVSLEAPDRHGRRAHVVLGFDDVAGYAAAKGSFGAVLGRAANRLAGGRIVIDGKAYELSRNEKDATLHGGVVGFGRRFWRVASADAAEVTLTLVSRDGDQGFPGEVEAHASYRLSGAELRLAFDARTTKPTPLSLSAHPYFNLDGLAARDCFDHRVAIFAAEYLPTDERQIPTGERRPVGATPFDFATPRAIGSRIRADDVQLRYGRGYDHYFILPEDGAGKLRLAARIEAAESGRILDILTTQRGLQFYTANNLDGSVAGRGGLYRQSAGFVFEPQGFPDAPNQPNFPTTVLRPGERYHEEIVYRFSSDGHGANT